MMRERIEELLENIARKQEKYKKFIKKGDKVRKRERDTFLTEKDRPILIESFVVGGLLEKLILKFVDRIF